MSTADSTFAVVLKQLAPDARKAGLEFKDATLEVSSKDLRTLLRSAETLAPSVSYPLTPELRVTAPSGRFVVQLKDGRLHFISWSSAKSRGGNPTADQIHAIIVGEEVQDDTTPVAVSATEAGTSSSKAGRWLLIAGLAVVIVGVNLYSIWNYRKPPGKLLPPFRLLQQEPEKRLLESVAGQYETGAGPGDRRLEIAQDGRVVWFKFGPNRAPTDRKEFTAQGAESEGQPALFTSRNAIIKVKDTTSVLLFGDTYNRVLQ